MSDKPVAARLGLKSGHRLLLVAPPPGTPELLGPLPEGATVTTGDSGPFDAVIVFVPTSATLTTHSARAVAALKRGGLLWLAYPKKTGAIESDMYRERAWEAFEAYGFRPVSQISIDDTWSALRFRPTSDVKSTR
jgi:hypothetical protein